MLTADELKQIVGALLPIIRPQSNPNALGTELIFLEQTFSGLPSVSFNQILANDPTRVLVMFMPVASGTLKISTKTGTPASSGFALSTSSLPIVFSVRDHGTVPQQNFFAADTSGGAAILTVFTLNYKGAP
jgi:hypothetical protein